MSTESNETKVVERSKRRENLRLVLGLVCGILITLFAVLNFGEVEVNWIFGSAKTPLIIVIAVSVLFGAAITWALGLRRRRRS